MFSYSKINRCFDTKVLKFVSIMRFLLADWKYRHAGLMALSAIGEGCHQQMEAILQEIVSFVLLFCADPVRKRQPL